MEKYSIYCTEEQTRKALELGAPISRIPINGYDGSRPSYFKKSPDEEGWAECPAYYIPTAEQMIGWLEEQGIIIEMVKCEMYWFARAYSDEKNTNFNKGRYTSRKEATIAAIDAALEYLSNNKK